MLGGVKNITEICSVKEKKLLKVLIRLSGTTDKIIMNKNLVL